MNPWIRYLSAFTLLALSGVALTDTRTPIDLEPAAREHVLAEMRHFLEGVAAITNALTKEDMETVARAAKTMGTAMTGDVPLEVRRQLPAQFRMLGHDMHRAFDTLALDAEQLGDPRHSLQQLGGILEGCAACHRSYRFNQQQP